MRNLANIFIWRKTCKQDVESRRREQWKQGVQNGIPIALGYMAVAFTFGIAATGILTPLQAGLMSATNYTSAGQFAALGLIAAGAPYLEMALTQFVINLRYFLMSCALSQKLEGGTPLSQRLLLACGVTDEIFGVSACRAGKLNPWFTYGVMSVAMPGWVLGTLMGILSGNLLPAAVLRALSVAIYGMFIAVVIPPAKQNRVLAGVVVVSMLASFAFDHIELLASVSGGFKIIVLIMLIAGCAAAAFPVAEDGQPVRKTAETTGAGGAE